MKAINLFVAMAAIAATVSFSSCEKNDEAVDDGSVKFTSGIAASQTRVGTDGDGKSSWAKDDPIGIYMVENGTAIVVAGATNMKYTAAAAGTSTTFNAAPTAIYYPVAVDPKVSFIAYHPHSTSIVDWAYPVNVATQTPQTAIDLMYATNDNSTNGYDKTDSSTPVNFVFDHQLVKMILNVTKASGVTGDLTAVAINGMNTKASFDLKGTDGLTGANTQVTIAPFAATAGLKYEAILLPVALLGAGHTVTFTCGGETYTWPMKSNELTSLDKGKIYTFAITLTKYAVEVGESSISKWESAGVITGVAE